MSLKILILPGVALRKESVDRNCTMTTTICTASKSLSARRAWIEIVAGYQIEKPPPRVALRKESVDRNNYIIRLYRRIVKGRSPQGERG